MGCFPRISIHCSKEAISSFEGDDLYMGMTIIIEFVRYFWGRSYLSFQGIQYNVMYKNICK